MDATAAQMSGLSGAMGGHKVEVHWDEKSQSFDIQFHLSSGRIQHLNHSVRIDQNEAGAFKRKQREASEEADRGLDSDSSYSPKRRRIEASVEEDQLRYQGINALLPVEILLPILQDVVANDSSKIMRLVCMHVCKLWKDLVTPELKWSLSGDFHQVCVKIVEQGWPSVAKWAIEKGFPHEGRVWGAIAKAGYLDLLKWGKETRNWDDEYIFCGRRRPTRCSTVGEGSRVHVGQICV